MAEGAVQRIHFKQSPLHLVALALIAVAGADLATGNSSKPLLPSAIGNLLTQQTDFILLAIAAFMLIFIS